VNQAKCHPGIAATKGTKCGMGRSSVLFVSAALLHTACVTAGPQEDCTEVIALERLSRLG